MKAFRGLGPWIWVELARDALANERTMKVGPRMQKPCRPVVSLVNGGIKKAGPSLLKGIFGCFGSTNKPKHAPQRGFPETRRASELLEVRRFVTPERVSS